MTPDRRTLLRAGFGATAALASPIGPWTTPAGGAARGLPPVEGEVSCDADACAAAGEDFGRIVHAQPQMVVRPKSSDDVAKVMQWAAARKVKVAARGHGHSVYGRSLAEGGIVIDMTSLDTIGEAGPDSISAGAGATWADVLEAASARGLTPPVLTNYLGLTIGGTIAIGGIGGSSSRHGLQADNVIELQVVTGDGRDLTCSPDRNPDLFDAVRAGLGQCGIVTRTTLSLVRAPERVRRIQLYYPDLASMTADQRRLLDDGRFDQLQGAVVPDGKGGWRYLLDGAVFYGHDAPDQNAVLKGLSHIASATVTTDFGYRDDAHGFARLEAMLRSNGHWFNPQPWLFTFLRASTAEQVAGEIVAELTGEDVGPFGRVTFYPLRTDAFRAPLVRMPEGPVAFVFNLVRIPATNDAGQIERMVAANRAIYQRVREAGGVLYPVSALPMSPDDWRTHFGPAWTRLAEARRRYDPNDLLTPGYNIA
jgi:FAD/FMN-containing dehydrogenase